MDGLSLTHGPAGRRQHIWTFAGGLNEDATRYAVELKCPCDNSKSTASPPYVGGNYFCESGAISDFPTRIILSNDPLWDGEGCHLSSTCCQFNNPPWFTTTLPAPTTDDMELRLCHINPTMDTDIPVELIELYVK